MIFDLRKHTIFKEDTGILKVIFMGSGQFALPILKSIVENKNFNLILTVTKPYSKQSTSNNSYQNEIKEMSVLNDSVVLQPKKIDTETTEKIANLKPDVIIVASYGEILSQEFLDIPKHGSVNIHASLLPELRGASPVQNAIIQNKEETGVTLMKMDSGLDTGDIISQSSIKIQPVDTTHSLLEKLSRLGAELLTRELEKWISGEMTQEPQNPEEATLCQLIDRSDGHIIWLKTSQEIYNYYRALSIWPGIFAFWRKTEIDLIRIKLIKIELTADLSLNLSKYEPGTVFIENKEMFVRTHDSAIKVTKIQRDGKKIMDIQDFLNGNPDIENSKLI